MSSKANEEKPNFHRNYERPYRPAHQTISLTDIQFNNRIVVGFTQIVIWPLIPNLRQVYLNCKQCKIHGIVLDAAESETDNPDHKSPSTYEVPIIYNDPSLEICKVDAKSRVIDIFEERNSSLVSMVDADNGYGELNVSIPPEFWPLISKLKAFVITIEFSIVRPKAGLYFVHANEESRRIEKGAHLYTSCPPNSSRLWFPCIDSSEPCTWKIEITVDEDLVAVASGDLIDAPQYTKDLRHKTYQFFLGQPIAAPYIGFAVGDFDLIPDDKIGYGSTHFAPSGLISLLEHTIKPLKDMVEYYENILTTQLPFKGLKTVFVDQAYEDFQSFASLIIYSVDLLHSAQIIDQAIATRKILAMSVAQQFFGCFLPMKNFCDAWLPIGIAGYLSGLYQKRVFGNNEYMHVIASEMRHITNYEHNKNGIILDPSQSTRSSRNNLMYPQLISPDHTIVYGKKSHLVIRMLELRLGQPVLLQVLNKLLVLATMSVDTLKSAFVNNEQSNPEGGVGSDVPQCLTDEMYNSFLLSTDSFKKIISTVTGQDITNFLEHWVLKAGHVRLFAKFLFNRKRNVVELELKQDLQSRSMLNYTGPISAMLQEVDGTFMHTFKLEEGRTSKDLPCHSKSRKHKKKKICLSNGEEVDMDLARVDPDSPLLWLRIDPRLALIRHIRLEMSDFMWQLMAAYEKDCVGQMEAVAQLAEFSTQETRHVLTNIIADERLFYRVRVDACFAICRVANELANVGSMPASQVASCLIPFFWQLFSSPGGKNFIKQNDFSYFQHYYLQRSIIRAVATLRIQQICPREVLSFLLDLSRYNDNSRNSFSDSYYRSDIIKALKDTLTPAILARGVLSAASLPQESRAIVEEVIRHLNYDTQLPSYKSLVTAIRRLQRFGFLPNDPDLFYQYTESGYYYSVRLGAIECLVDLVRSERDQKVFNSIFEKVICNENRDEVPTKLRFDSVRLLTRLPPFQRNESNNRLDSPELVESIWKLMNYSCSMDSRLRRAVADLYFALYGRNRPSCLPVPEGMVLVNVKAVKSTKSSSSAQRSRVDENLSPNDDSNKKIGPDPKEGSVGIEDSGPPPQKKRMERLSDDEDDIFT